jgi:acyl carrier protein
MERQMENELRGIFSDVLGIDRSEISDETSPENTTTWDSLAMVNLITAIEEFFQIALDFDELVNFSSFGAVKNMLLEKRDAQ